MKSFRGFGQADAVLQFRIRLSLLPCVWKNFLPLTRHEILPGLRLG